MTLGAIAIQHVDDRKITERILSAQNGCGASGRLFQVRPGPHACAKAARRTWLVKDQLQVRFLWELQIQDMRILFKPLPDAAGEFVQALEHQRL
jgi:hypothetical protein